MNCPLFEKHQDMFQKAITETLRIDFQNRDHVLEMIKYKISRTDKGIEVIKENPDDLREQLERGIFDDEAFYSPDVDGFVRGERDGITFLSPSGRPSFELPPVFELSINGYSRKVRADQIQIKYFDKEQLRQILLSEKIMDRREDKSERKKQKKEEVTTSHRFDAKLLVQGNGRSAEEERKRTGELKAIQDKKDNIKEALQKQYRRLDEEHIEKNRKIDREKKAEQDFQEKII